MLWSEILDKDEKVDDDDELHLPPDETTTDDTGISTTVAYDRERIKDKDMTGNNLPGPATYHYFVITRKFRHFPVKVRKALAAIERAEKGFSKFGNCAGKPSCPEKGIISRVLEEIYFVFEHEAEQKKAEKDEADIMKLKKVSVVKCKHCGGPHWSRACTQKHLSADKDADSQGGGRGAQNGAPGKYRPPGARRGQDTDDLDLEPTLKITNIPTHATQDNIRALLKRYRIGTLRLAKDRSNFEQNLNRGFAFVTFMSIHDAQKAMKEFDKHRCGFMILAAEWSENYKKYLEKRGGLEKVLAETSGGGGSSYSGGGSRLGSRSRGGGGFGRPADGGGGGGGRPMGRWSQQSRRGN